MAAGKGTRMGNPELPKVLSMLCGKPMIRYILATLAKTEYPKAAIIVGYHQEKVREELGSEYTYVVQEEQLGTGHALACCKDQLAGTADYFLVMNGDQPLTSVHTLQELAEQHIATGAVMSLVTVSADDDTFANFGRIIRDEAGRVVAIREFKDCTEEEKAIKEANAGVYCFSDNWMWPHLAQLKPENAQAEYYITDLLGIAVQEGRTISTVALKDMKEGLGVNNPNQLAQVEQALQAA
jgi:bifunctional UDP-N-acetylglucosamine pyrophosphorylase/glucosamine-1-phosphate N-acetyltransferase